MYLSKDEWLEAYEKKDGTHTMEDLIESANELIKNSVELNQSEWIDVLLNVYDDRYGTNKHNLRTKCSICGYAMPREYPRFNICPNCGAKMKK